VRRWLKGKGPRNTRNTRKFGKGGKGGGEGVPTEHTEYTENRRWRKGDWRRIFNHKTHEIRERGVSRELRGGEVDALGSPAGVGGGGDRVSGRLKGKGPRNTRNPRKFGKGGKEGVPTEHTEYTENRRGRKGDWRWIFNHKTHEIYERG